MLNKGLLEAHADPITRNEVAQFYKAVSSAGTEYKDLAPGGFSAFGARAQEDLSEILHVVTFTAKDLSIWKDISKDGQNQIVHQYNIKTSYGADVPIFTSEADNPEPTDAEYERIVRLVVKFASTFGQITRSAILQNSSNGGNLEAEQVVNKTTQLLGNLERGLFDSSESVDQLEFTGLPNQIQETESNEDYMGREFRGYLYEDNSPVVDLAGKGLSESLCSDIIRTSRNNGGEADHCYLSNTTLDDFSKRFLKRLRGSVEGTNGVYAGKKVLGVDTALGRITFRPSRLAERKKSTRQVSGQKAPTLAAVNDADSGGSKAAKYEYQVSVTFRDGESAISADLKGKIASGSLADSPADKTLKTVVTLDAGSLTKDVRWANVYRRDNEEGEFRFVSRRKLVAKDLSAKTYDLILDDKFDITPGLEHAFVVGHGKSSAVFKQYGPMVKWELAVMQPVKRWLQMLYGAPLLYIPRKHVSLINAGKGPSAADGYDSL